MDIIVRGEPQELDFVRRLCRDKVRRGLLAILPATSPACDEVVRLKNERDETKSEMAILAKENERLASENAGLYSRIEELEKSLADQIPDVPKIGESVPNIEEKTENVADSVSEPDTIGNDMVEVNLDDVKDPPAPDVKSEPEADIKDAPETTPKKKTRTKKSE